MMINELENFLKERRGKSRIFEFGCHKCKCKSTSFLVKNDGKIMCLKCDDSASGIKPSGMILSEALMIKS